jgi:uncharacterized membrane protein
MAYNLIAGRSIERINALSDGLFAIAMTLIVLDVRVPSQSAIRTEGDLARALGALAPQMATYVMSFLTLGIFWVGQQAQLNQLKQADRDFTWIQLGFLATVAVLPFTTRLLAEFVTFEVALVIYWLNIVALGALLYASWFYAERAGLVKDNVAAGLGGAIRRRIVFAQLFYAGGAALCLISNYLSIGVILLIQLYYAVAPRWREERRGI